MARHGIDAKKRRSLDSSGGNVDETGELVDDELSHIEREIPADETEPVERPAEAPGPEPPTFEK